MLRMPPKMNSNHVKILIKKILKESILDHVTEIGTLPNGAYYFDPPLIEPEIKFLYKILGGLMGSDRILNPLTHSGIKNLIWIDVVSNIIDGWQNEDEDEDEDGSYTIRDYESIKRWFKRNYPWRHGRSDELIDGRKRFGLTIDFSTDISNIFDNL